MNGAHFSASQSAGYEFSASEPSKQRRGGCPGGFSGPFEGGGGKKTRLWGVSNGKVPLLVQAGERERSRFETFKSITAKLNLSSLAL